MSFGGSVSAMISSLKSNNSLRRGKKNYSKFYKKPVVSNDDYNPISKEENLIIIEKNKKKLRKQSMFQYVYGVIMLLFFGSIVGYLLIEFFKWI